MLNYLITLSYIITIFLLINVLLRIYNKYFISSYLFNIYYERIFDVNGFNIMNFFTFKNIKSSPFMIWKSRQTYIIMLKSVLFMINNDPHLLNQYKNFNISIVFFEFDPNLNLLKPISDGFIIKFNDIDSVEALVNNINWNESAFNTYLNDIIIRISN